MLYFHLGRGIRKKMILFAAWKIILALQKTCGGWGLHNHFFFSKAPTTRISGVLTQCIVLGEQAMNTKYISLY